MSRSRVVNLTNLPQFTAINVLSDPGVSPGKKIIPACVQVVLCWTLANGKTGRNVLAMSVGAAFQATATQAETIRAGIVSGGAWTTYAGFLATTTALARVELRDIRTPDMPIVSSTGASTPGTSASPALPGEVAVCMTIRTSKTGPGNRGRYYLPGFATNALASGDVIAPAVMSAANALTGNINSAIIAVGGTWVLAQPDRVAYTGSTGTQHPARAATTLATLSVLCRDNHWDSQRRRGLK